MSEPGYDIASHNPGSCLYTEDGPPTDVADRTSASFPDNFMRNGISQRQTEAIAERDRLLLEGLKKRGFKTTRNMRIDGTGFPLLAWTRPGLYYLDVGASEVVVNDKIGLKFEDGSVVEADVAILLLALETTATSSARCTLIWGLDSDGEIRGTWRDLSMKGLWYIMSRHGIQNEAFLQSHWSFPSVFLPRTSRRVVTYVPHRARWSWLM
ncbi:hypothetical protein K435DRAFT_892463 [Dendrothele bispora CBS 962.96]|uniref:Uncharacterized protein n=1 Tax=Dendrothele bispora (strain CBS 962.96) TaxID=1314807 RepID=A0A4S8M481_DENBC|nr:hypothetical protein K435DRAFT_892463 [Dendrothele bispora CBS 962.96]